ncbi:TetR family transcriptional regulator [Pseudomonas sp. HAR-UPW-AIA-41]|uniref:TetR/AcrR family transcriptional regulator n=1 Tax=Pseudomonas sp. HAR-UPW-AIA-41 TaxID=1985301 RepID=UPI000BB3D825|nr:TetR/AcrR family transcriptional regulator [Pseudomonas sp. HAR-UPW-AIA-41]PAV48976.1 TetR family transcriptional regulator [Pseudomonas sp. HAR-UPW-AIA-41]
MTAVQSKSRGRKRQIIDAALRCFSEHGVSGTTIDMIREASATSVGSLYHHFGNKEAIAAAVFIEGMRDFALQVASRLDSANGAEEGIKALVAANVEWISANPDWARFCFHHRAQVRHEDATERLRGDQQLFQERLHDWFAPYRGALRDLPIEVFAALVVGPTHDYARHWLAGRITTPLLEQLDTFAEAAWRSVRTEAESSSPVLMG